jgi:hypothetical protein
VGEPSASPATRHLDDEGRRQRGSTRRVHFRRRRSGDASWRASPASAMRAGSPLRARSPHAAHDLAIPLEGQGRHAGLAAVAAVANHTRKTTTPP